MEPGGRRAALVAAARRVFAEHGTAAAVSDIVRAAGVAQGTFYLYFRTKDDIVNAVAQGLVDDMVAELERAVSAPTLGAVEKFVALRDAILAMAQDSAGQKLAAPYHRPENRAVHDRMAERAARRMAPLIEKIVRQGLAEGVFVTSSPRVAAWFVVGGFHLLEEGFSGQSELVAAVGTATDCALRALGYAGPPPSPLIVPEEGP